MCIRDRRSTAGTDSRPLNTPDVDRDRRIEPELQWLQVRLAGMPESARGAAGDNRCRIVDDVEGLLASRYDLKPGTCYLFRPDQHVTARTRFPDPQRLRAALERAAGLQSSTESPR